LPVLAARGVRHIRVTAARRQIGNGVDKALFANAIR
jgi:hypothetical protein